MQSDLSITIKRILNDSYLFFIHHFYQISTLCLPFLFITTLFDFFLAATYGSTPMALFAPLAFNLLIYPLYTAALIHLMSRRARQEQPKNGELVVSALQQWGPLLLLKGIMIFLIGMGFFLFVIPGIWLAVRLSFAEFYLVLFKVHPRDALQKSMSATKGRFTLILMLMLMTYVPILFLGLAIDQFVLSMTANDFLRIVISAAWALVGLFVHVVLFRTFMEVVVERIDIRQA